MHYGGTPVTCIYDKGIILHLRRTSKSHNPSTTMNKESVLSKVQSLSGQHIHIEFKSEGTPSKDYKGVKLEKITSGAFRVGIDYANLSEVKEAIEKGERGEVEPLPWGTWLQFPYMITHKEKNYLRLYPATGGAIQKPKVKYLVEGAEVDKDQYFSYMTESNRKPSDKPCFVVDINNLITIG